LSLYFSAAFSIVSLFSIVKILNVVVILSDMLYVPLTHHLT